MEEDDRLPDNWYEDAGWRAVVSAHNKGCITITSEMIKAIKDRKKQEK